MDMERSPMPSMNTVPAPVPSPQPGPLKRLFGQFATVEFWEEMFALLVRESIAALISAIGGTLVTLAASRRSEASQRVRTVVDQATNAAAGRSPNVAFSGGFQPQATYRPSYPAGVPQQPTTATVTPPYPGY